MKFFVPHAEDEEEAESLFDDIKEFVKRNAVLSLTPARIYRFEYVHHGKSEVVQVGQPYRGEEVMAILDSFTHLVVCTPSFGLSRGLPFLIPKSDVQSVESFEEPP